MEFKERLKELRKSRSLSQVELADKLGIAKGLVAMYETGDRLPSRNSLEKIADFFNVDVDYLLGRSDVSTYVLDPKVENLLRVMDERPEIKTLLDASVDISKEDIEAVLRLLTK